MQRLGFLAVCFLLPTIARADAPVAKPARPAPGKVRAKSADRKWTVDDVLLAEKAGDFRISPDGRWAVWVRSIMDEEKGDRVSNLMRSSLTDQRVVRLTRGRESSHSPRWSPDGRLIAFLSARPNPEHEGKQARSALRAAETDDEKDKEQIWLIDPFGGEPWRLTDYPRGVNGFAWLGADALAFFAKEEQGQYETVKTKDRKDDSLIVEDEKHEPPVRLFRVDVESKKVERLTDNRDRIESLDVSPDGRWAVTKHNRSLRYEYDGRIKPVWLLHDLQEKRVEKLTDDPKRNVSSVVWAPDSQGLFVVNHFNNNPEFDYPSIPELYFYQTASRTMARVDLSWENGLAGEAGGVDGPALAAVPGGFVALLADGARNRSARFTRKGDRWERAWLEGEHASHLFGVAASPDGQTLVYAHSTASTPTRWSRSDLKGASLVNPAVVAEPYSALAAKTVARSEVVRWKGARDEEVEGILYHPHERKDGEKRPLVVMIHGGPAAADFDSWEENWAYAANLFCQRGAFVLKPNYHGSSNYGLSWVESITRGRYYDLEVQDIEKGVDALIAKGLVDPDRLGVLGWSNGSILTIALTVQTTRYKAAVAGAGDVDWVSDWGNCEFGESFDRAYFGKSPTDDPETYIRKSPFYRLDRVRTPTLILFGTEDRTVPTQQGWMHYRALQQHGKTDVRFVLFPGAKHGLAKLAHQRRKLEEELAWFDRHLFRTAPEHDEIVKEGSPLARALKLQGARRDGQRFGERVDGVLVPETVAFRGLSVGRFEVTRAQFACFDPTYQVEPGKENFPAGDVSFERAQQYCRWLSKSTGQTFRLPDEKEGEELYGCAATGENTLDHWAGYPVNPDDARALGARLASLGRGGLLREVGSFAASDESAGLFDLCGNVAEWTVTAGGKPRLRGGSADRPADAKQTEAKAAAEYRGFRVVREDRPANR